MCLRRFEEACKLGEPVLSFDSGQPHVDNEGYVSLFDHCKYSVSKCLNHGQSKNDIYMV
jgi:hypothetical protein